MDLFFLVHFFSVFLKISRIVELKATHLFVIYGIYVQVEFNEKKNLFFFYQSYV